MSDFLNLWGRAAYTTVGLFWMAFWAFGLGYLISSMIQIFVTRQRMKNAMGKAGAKSVGLATFFGFISSSCSFAALSTTRALFTKGAGIIPSLAFLLASTNLVIELGIVISIFLSWQFVVGEYLGGVILILLMALFVKLTLPSKLEKTARENAKESSSSNGSDSSENWKKLITSKKGWLKVSDQYLMEWKMVWKDVTVGFTIAGIIAAFVPKSFFESLFIGAGGDSFTFWQILIHSLIGPVAAFFTFIGSMGNIPLAAVLFNNGVSFAGVMAFIFSDLIVFPVLRIQTKYYGLKMAFYILFIFLIILVLTSIIMHYGFSFFDLLPQSGSAKNISDRNFFKIDYSFFLNIAFLILSFSFLGWSLKKSEMKNKESKGLTEKILFSFSIFSFLWLAIGLVIH